MSSSESSTSSSEDEADAGRHKTSAKPTPTSVSKSRLITSSSDSEDSSDADVAGVTLLKSRVTPDKSRKTPAAASTPLPRQSIYTSSDNDDDSDSDSLTSPLKKVKQASPTARSKTQTKKAVRSATKKPLLASAPPSSSKASKPSGVRESLTEPDAAVAAKTGKPAVKDFKKQHSHQDSVLGGVGQMARKEVKVPTKGSLSDKQPVPVPHRHMSSLFGDALAKSAAQARAGSKSAKEEMFARKDLAFSRTADAPKSSSVASAVSSSKQKSSRPDVDSIKSKHSVLDSRHPSKSSGGTAESKSASERTVKLGYDLASPEHIGRKLLESEAVRMKKPMRGDQHVTEADSDGSPLIRPGNIFEKLEKQDSRDDKINDAAQMFGDVAQRRHSAAVAAAADIAVFMPESDDDDDDDREPIVEASKLSIERLKEDSAKEETIEEAVKAIIEFTKEPSTPPLSSSKADSDLLDDSAETADDDIGLSDDVGELNAAIGNLIEKELEPSGADSLTSMSIGADKTSDSSMATVANYRSSTRGGLAQPKTELSTFNTGGGLKEDQGGIKMEVEGIARHIQTPAHDEQNVTSFMSRLEKATADVVDFASISAAAAASKKLPESKPTSEMVPCAKPPEVSSQLFASSIPSAPVKTEDEKPGLIKKEESSEAGDMVKPEPPEFPLSTKIFSSSKQQAEVHGMEKSGAEPASGDDSSTMADLYEFKDDDEADARQKDFVLHKRSRKRRADSESSDAVDVDVKKRRSSSCSAAGFVKTADEQEAAAITDQGPTTVSTSVSASESHPASTQSSWRTNMDLVIEAVARGEFERGDDSDYYSAQNATTASAGKGRRGRTTSRDDATATSHKPPSTLTGSLASSLPSLPAEGFGASTVANYQRSVSAVAVGSTSSPMTGVGGGCSPRLLLSGISAQQIQQIQRMYPPGSLAATGESVRCITLETSSRTF